MSDTARSHAHIRDGPLWFGVFAGPIAWIVQFTFGYVLEDTVCSPASQSEKVAGIPIDSLYLAGTLALALVTATAGLVAYRGYRSLSGPDPGSKVAERARWMALAGLLVSVLFLVIIVLAFASITMVGFCEISP